MDYASSILGFLPGGRRSTGISQLLDKLEDLPAARSSRAGTRSLRISARNGIKARSAFRANRTSRTRSRSPTFSRTCASTRDTLVAAILHDVIEDTPTAKAEIASIFGAGRRRSRRRRQQTRPDPVQEPPGSAGRELSQDAARDGARYPRHHGQARRPHAQHAHPRRHAAGQAPAHRPRDPRDLRADRRTAGSLRGQARTRGFGVPGALPVPLQGARARTQTRARQPEGIHRQRSPKLSRAP